MAEQPTLVEAIARRSIEECRRDIEAVRLQIEAMRAILAKSRWMLAKWEEWRRTEATTGGLRLPAYDGVKPSGFIAIGEAKAQRRKRRRRA